MQMLYLVQHQFQLCLHNRKCIDPGTPRSDAAPAAASAWATRALPFLDWVEAETAARLTAAPEKSAIPLGLVVLRKD
jgi:hypothetical protein